MASDAENKVACWLFFDDIVEGAEEASFVATRTRRFTASRWANAGLLSHAGPAESGRGSP